MKNKVYLSGPIRGNENYKESFDIIKKNLQDKGYVVISPADNPEGLTQRDYMRISLAQLDSCDFIFMLPGWEKSEGSKIEKLYADCVGIKCINQF